MMVEAKLSVLQAKDYHQVSDLGHKQHFFLSGLPATPGGSEEQN